MKPKSFPDMGTLARLWGALQQGVTAMESRSEQCYRNKPTRQRLPRCLHSPGLWNSLRSRLPRPGAWHGLSSERGTRSVPGIDRGEHRLPAPRSILDYSPIDPRSAPELYPIDIH